MNAKKFLYEKWDIFWWVFLGITLINYLASKMVVEFYMYIFITQVLPYFIFLKRKQDRWFFTYFISTTFGFLVYRPFAIIFLGGQPFPLLNLISWVGIYLVGITASLYYFNKKENKILPFIFMIISFWVAFKAETLFK